MGFRLGFWGQTKVSLYAYNRGRARQCVDKDLARPLRCLFGSKSGLGDLAHGIKAGRLWPHASRAPRHLQAPARWLVHAIGTITVLPSLQAADRAGPTSVREKIPC